MSTFDTKNTRDKVLKRLQSLSSKVVLRADFNELGSYRQISRALHTLVSEKKLAKIGFGIYAKAYPSQYTDLPLIAGGTDVAFRQALKRLGVQWKTCSDEQAYNQKQTTQVPAFNRVRLKSRFRRRIGYGKSRLIFEGNTNAR
jgi:hypothetical protein